MLFDAVFDTFLIKSKSVRNFIDKKIVENDETKHSKNERHTAWERYLDGKPVATATLREHHVIKQMTNRQKRAGPQPQHDSIENLPNLHHQIIEKNDPRLAWELNLVQQTFVL